MINFLIKFKRAFPAIWVLFEKLNGLFFSFVYYGKIKQNAISVLSDFSDQEFSFRFLEFQDLNLLASLFQNQVEDQFNYFKPHFFDLKTLERLFYNSSFFMFGVFKDNTLVGYFFLRCFLNRKSFIGRFVDKKYQGCGLGKKMGMILYSIAWNSGFRVFSTISLKNGSSLASHKANSSMKVKRRLNNDYLLVEFIR